MQINLSAFSFVPLIYMSIFMPVPYGLDDSSFILQSEVKQVDSSTSLLFLKIALAIRGFVCFHMNFEIMCFSSVKNTIGSLIGIAFNLQMFLGGIYIFTILIIPIHEHGAFLHLFVSSVFLSSVFYSYTYIGLLFLQVNLTQVFYSFHCKGEWDCFLHYSFLIVSVQECKGFLCVNFISCNFTILIDQLQ